MQLALVIAQEGGGLGINAGAFIAQLISFLIVLLILWKWVFPIFTKMLDKRQAIIREGIENAEKAKRDLEEASARAEEILAQARRDAQATIERATRDAQRVAQNIEEEARARTEQIYQQQVARIQQEANRARNELSRLVVNLSIEAAERVIGKSMNTRDNRRLVEEFVTASNSGNQNNQARNN
ncbi:MAG: F0F1 ATP synthase subunit B [Ktedonobacteraceae bacterium]|nr:F0F1 ATP synthase subunit B [Ktedonobacteraceae bacterium]